MKDSRQADARRAGYAAQCHGTPLNSNPFDFDREHDEWEAWRGGWIQASEDQLERLQS
jgi:ribosome modulation factor